MEFLQTGLGMCVLIVAFFVAVITFLLPFFVWGIYNQMVSANKKLDEIRFHTAHLKTISSHLSEINVHTDSSAEHLISINKKMGS